LSDGRRKNIHALVHTGASYKVQIGLANLLSYITGFNGFLIRSNGVLIA